MLGKLLGAKYLKTIGHILDYIRYFAASWECRAQPDWAYEFPDWTGQDSQICWTGLNLDFYFLNILTAKQEISVFIR